MTTPIITVCHKNIDSLIASTSESSCMCNGHKLLGQFSMLYISNTENSKTDFSDVVTTHNHQICYVKHVLGPLSMFFTLFWYWAMGQVSQWTGAQPASSSFPPLAAQKWNFWKLVF